MHKETDPWPQLSQGGEVIAIDASDLIEVSKRCLINRFSAPACKTAAYLAMHGIGHLSGINHANHNSAIMLGGNGLFYYFLDHRDLTYDGLFNRGEYQYIKVVKNRFLLNK